MSNELSTRRYISAFMYDLALQGPVEMLVLGSRRRKLIARLNGLILEIGAGTGLSLRYYAASSKVIATEPDLASILRLRDKARHAHTRITPIAASAMSLPFADATFDGLVCNLALCTIPDPALALAEARRVLKPGSPARFLEHVRSTNPVSARAQDVLAPLWAKVADGCRLNQDTERIIREAGLRVEWVEKRRGFLLPMKLIWASNG
ncbi:MAG TPA: methyltransferase domain-containing protein [Chloroflexia bacterium]|jgi:ubiquinone/menaquinone biosynthesis C-methylase UbiE